MRQLKIIAMVPVAMVWLVWCASLSGSDAQSPGQLTGIVRDQPGDPIGEAAVTLVSTDRVLETRTAANGSFLFDGTPIGPYQLEVVATGFIKQRLQVDIRDGTPKPQFSIVLKIGGMAEHCGPEVSPSYRAAGSASPSLSGIVRPFMGGKSLGHVEVTARLATDRRTQFKTKSDKAGKFTFATLPPGRYNIRMELTGYQPMEIQQVIPRENGTFLDAELLEVGGVIICG